MMRKSLFILLMCTGFTASANNMSQLETVNKALTGDYQTQRNLAYNYSNGWGSQGDVDFFPKSPIHACAWRKVILLTNTDRINNNDYSNESIDCKNVHPTENKEVWSLVFGILQKMSK